MGLVKSALKKNHGMNKIDSSQPTTDQIKDQKAKPWKKTWGIIGSRDKIPSCGGGEG
jgi:hypothetical protein